MLETVFGSPAAERVLLYLHNYEEGHARGIARTFNMPVFGVQRQLRKFEDAGLLVSRLVGRTRLYTWNPRYALRLPLRNLLTAALEQLPADQIRAHYRERRRPRRPGKPL